MINFRMGEAVYWQPYSKTESRYDMYKKIIMNNKLLCLHKQLK